MKYKNWMCLIIVIIGIIMCLTNKFLGVFGGSLSVAGYLIANLGVLLYAHWN